MAPRSRHQNKVKRAKILYGERFYMEKWKKSQKRMRDLTDHNANLYRSTKESRNGLERTGLDAGQPK